MSTSLGESVLEFHFEEFCVIIKGVLGSVLMYSSAIGLLSLMSTRISSRDYEARLFVGCSRCESVISVRPLTVDVHFFNLVSRILYSFELLREDPKVLVQ